MTQSNAARATANPARGREDTDTGRVNGGRSREIRCTAKLCRPATSGKPATWTFLVLPKEASGTLPSRGTTSVDGRLNDVAFRAILEPDGQGSHWLKVDRKLREAAGVEAGETVTLAITPSPVELEAKVPADLRKALAAAPQARALWSEITSVARRDWIQWIVSARQPETRVRRIQNACAMLAKGKRRVCCFDRSGIYSKALSAPKAVDA